MGGSVNLDLLSQAIVRDLHQGHRGKLTKKRIEKSTALSKFIYNESLLRADEAKKDSKECSRRNLNECKSCYYFLRRIAGKAFTQYFCENCGSSSMYASVPKLCTLCSKALNLCQRCGGCVDA